MVNMALGGRKGPSAPGSQLGRLEEFRTPSPQSPKDPQLAQRTRTPKSPDQGRQRKESVVCVYAMNSAPLSLCLSVCFHKGTGLN